MAIFHRALFEEKQVPTLCPRNEYWYRIELNHSVVLSTYNMSIVCEQADNNHTESNAQTQ
jgi:hypothetical protein